MALPTSGPISIYMILTEVGRPTTSAFSMNNSDVRTLVGIPTGPYSWSNFYGKTYETNIAITSNTQNLILKNLFTSSDWSSLKQKKVVIFAGVTVGSTNSSYAIAATVTADGQTGSWGGTLILENRGIISGIGGTANSGVGGNAIWVNFPGKTGQKLIINNSGTIRAGGGGGGRGGNGGNGSYDYTYYEPSSGWRFDAGINSAYYWTHDPNGDQNYKIYWNNNSIYNSRISVSSPYSSGGWTYERGSVRSSTAKQYELRRYQTRSQSTTGGIAGDGGKGQGFDGALTNGSGAVAGGTNAGASGASGNGGGWGAQGNTGASGSNGNVSSGTSGAAGGLAGYYLQNSQYATLNNTGTLQGRIT